MAKVTIVGAGNVGSQVAFYASLKEIEEVVLIDIVEGMPQGKALDILQATAVSRVNSKIIGSNDYLMSKN
ncbi:MAG: malate dehydrogenase, partial [Nanoarchaeota archaeon]|nr:malate dehydrogenase [Nanoarchaeota archaeon]